MEQNVNVHLLSFSISEDKEINQHSNDPFKDILSGSDDVMKVNE